MSDSKSFSGKDSFPSDHLECGNSKAPLEETEIAEILLTLNTAVVAKNTYFNNESDNHSDSSKSRNRHCEDLSKVTGSESLSAVTGDILNSKIEKYPFHYRELSFVPPRGDIPTSKPSGFSSSDFDKTSHYTRRKMNLTPQTKNTLVQETNTPTTTVCEGKFPHKLPLTETVPVEDSSSNRQIAQEPLRKISLVGELKEYTRMECPFGGQSDIPETVKILTSERAEKPLQDFSSNKENKSNPCRNETSINKNTQNKSACTGKITKNLPSEGEDKYIQEFSSNSQTPNTRFSKIYSINELIGSTIDECILVEEREIPPNVGILPSQLEETYHRSLSFNEQSKLENSRNKSFNVEQNMVQVSLFGGPSEIPQNVNRILPSGEGKLIQKFSSNDQIAIKPFRNESSIDGLRQNTIKESLFQEQGGIPQKRNNILFSISSSESRKNTLDDYKLNTRTPFLKKFKTYERINQPRKASALYDSQKEISSNGREEPVANYLSRYGRNLEKFLVKQPQLQSRGQMFNENQHNSEELLILKSFLSDCFITGGKNISFEKYSYFTDNLLMLKMLKECRNLYSKKYPANHDFAFFIISYIESLNYNSTEKFRLPLDENLQKLFKYMWNSLTDFFNVKTELQSFFPSTFMHLMIQYSIVTDQRKHGLSRFLYYCTIMAQVACIAKQHNFRDAPLYTIIFLQRSIDEIESYQNINFPVIVKEYAAELVNCLKL